LLSSTLEVVRTVRDSRDSIRALSDVD